MIDGASTLVGLDGGCGGMHSYVVELRSSGFPPNAILVETSPLSSSMPIVADLALSIAALPSMNVTS